MRIERRCGWKVAESARVRGIAFIYQCPTTTAADSHLRYGIISGFVAVGERDVWNDEALLDQARDGQDVGQVS